MVKAINHNNPKWCRHGQILEDMKGVLASFRWQEVVHVKRGANGAAHGLAKLATREHIDKIWMEEIPSSIYNIVISEHSALFV